MWIGNAKIFFAIRVTYTEENETKISVTQTAINLEVFAFKIALF